MNPHQNDDETLASCIKQSTQQRGKGRTKTDDPSPSQKRKNPKAASSEAHATHNRKRKKYSKANQQLFPAAQTFDRIRFLW
jgi:hypothetical protein